MIHTKIETEFHQTEDKSKLINVIMNFSQKFDEKIVISEKNQSKFISSETDGLDFFVFPEFPCHLQKRRPGYTPLVF